MRLADVDHDQPALKLPPYRSGNLYGRHAGMGKGVHLNKVDTAIGARQLILNARFQPQLLGFEGMGQGCRLVLTVSVASEGSDA